MLKLKENQSIQRRKYLATENKYLLAHPPKIYEENVIEIHGRYGDVLYQPLGLSLSRGCGNGMIVYHNENVLLR